MLCCPIAKVDYRDELAGIKECLTGLGYCGPDQLDGFMISPIAKFWNANRSDPIVVYPGHCGIKQLHEPFARVGVADFKPCRRNSALIVPMRPKSNTAARRRHFGSALASRLFAGGGPFILQDSRRLVVSVLRQLGFLDTKLNSDLREALLVFINCTHNKSTLRQLDLLPCKCDTLKDVSGKLREAFASKNSAGLWQLPPADAQLRQLLVRESFLERPTSPAAEVFDAMRKYAKMQGWPMMRSYIGLVWRITYERNRSDPNRRRVVELDA
ncbi:unnamed protein product [Symbiodinium natans]|uniref:Uncharacterized protein n=1 Tax=Symbiodinium natans TaxID=878477 RepID=A0A812Q9C6_9DINO|nr:unnamed protein product [Symbiodinium natans]